MASRRATADAREANRVAKQLALLLDCIDKMNTYLRYKGRAELQAIDREPLTSGFVKLEQEASLMVRGQPPNPRNFQGSL